MKDWTKIMITAVFALLTAVCGFLVRDSLDAPRLRIERAKYSLPRKQCVLSKEAYCRFKVSPSFQEFLKKTTSENILKDFADGKVEYANISDLLNAMPARRDELDSEVLFIQEQLARVNAYVDRPTPENKEKTKDLITYALGNLYVSEIMEKLGVAKGVIVASYAEIETNPKKVAGELREMLTGERSFFQNEIDTIDMLTTELRQFCAKGIPDPLPIAGTDVSTMPNVRFDITVSNRGKTQGMFSYVVLFVPESNTYRINLVGADYETSRPLEPHRYTNVKGNSASDYAHVIDLLRNQVEDIKKFYKDLASQNGISGTFILTDARGTKHEFGVSNLLPYN